MLKRKGAIADLKDIYILDKMIFKNEARTYEMLRAEMLSNENSKTLIIE